MMLLILWIGDVAAAATTAARLRTWRPPDQDRPPFPGVPAVVVLLSVLSRGGRCGGGNRLLSVRVLIVFILHHTQVPQLILL